MTNDKRWQRLRELFDCLLTSDEPERVLAAETDSEIRDEARTLWLQHLRASKENYLDEVMEFEINTVFEPGQVLLNRFRIDGLLGSGGMGEVYLAWDNRLESRVALKTIGGLLASSDSIRRRFVVEVQSARRVTHPNICRIHELFEDNGRVFFSMEHLDGAPLSEAIRKGISVDQRRSIVRQLAEALHAAHQTGVVHGDFKPANVMIVQTNTDVRAVIMDFGLARALDRAVPGHEEYLSVHAGTERYMAPELHSGIAPTVRSDIYAFGVTAREILPKYRIWDKCTQCEPQERFESLLPVIHWLNPLISRRAWLGGIAIVATGVTLYALRSPNSVVILPMGARILVNGFRTPEDNNSGARLLRSLLLTGVEHSSRVHPISDQDFFPTLRRLEPDATLPLAGRVLADMLTALRVDFWIGGALQRNGGRFSLNLQLMKAPAQMVSETTLHDLASLIPLAQAGSFWVRETAGESAQSLASGKSDLASYTSRVPEALERYYEAMEHYALGEMDFAVPLLRDALRLEPDFPQAHNMLALTVNSSRQYEEGFREIEIARRLSTNLPNRERTEIEANYARMTEDPLTVIDLAKRNVALRPYEPRALSDLGQTYINLGHFEEGTSALREAVRLAPDDWMPAQMLLAGLVEAAHFDQALNEFQKALDRGITNRWLYNGAGYACLGLERYDEAIRNFEAEPLDFENIADVQSAKILQGHLEGAIAALEQQRGLAQNPIELHRANEFLCGLYFVTDRPEYARRVARQLADLPVYPPVVRRLPGAASWVRRTGDGQTLAKIHEVAGRIVAKWSNPLTRAVEVHAEGLLLWQANDFEKAAGRLVEASTPALNPWALFDLAELYMRSENWDRAEAYWEQFESHRGTIFVKGWFPGILLLSWLYRATAAYNKNDHMAAFRYSGDVLRHWSESNPNLQIVKTARSLNFATQP